MKTEDKTAAAARVRIAVLGTIDVGKSALIVRYLTRRFIGEYRSNTDLLYRQTISVNSSPLEVEIVDVSGDTTEFPLEQVQWADACVVVYSITDKLSFQYAVEALRHFQKMRPVNGVPVTLLANKADLEHLREVEQSEGKTVALQYGCQFHEVSVAENSPGLYQAFESLLSECRCLHGTANHKSRKFSVSKMLGTLIGGGNNNSNNNNSNSNSNNLNNNKTGGTVVVCQKSDLHRSRVLKRRQNFAATASL
ncbi:ras-like protein family member 11B [Bacillus rossius redtenbacheri]|uniref:ras-like protein family member 11B n=1 Tax=Bacillus rossius redtenbacheri TaxID=93214 RepID=UPI002FDCF50B